MRGRTSASCFWASALVSALEKCACGIATCEWMSMVVLFGLTSRPGLPCLRAAVAAYLFHWFIICLLFVFTEVRVCGRSFPRKRESRICLAGFVIWVPAFAGTSGPDAPIQHPEASEHTQVLRHNGVVEFDLIGGTAKHHATGIDDDD